MKNGRSIREWQRPLAFLAEAPLSWLTPRAQISHFSRGATVCAGDQLAEWAFLVLSGRCERRCELPDAGVEILQTYQCGESFGGLSGRETRVVAGEDSEVLQIRLRELANITPRVNGHSFSPSPETSDTTRFTFTLNAPKGKIVTLAFLSALQPENYLAENIARQLHSETDASVVLVQLVASVAEAVDGVLNGGFVLPTELREIEPGLRLLRIRVSGESPGPEVLGELLETLRCRFNHVLLELAADCVPTQVLFECIIQSRTAFFFLRRNSEDLYHLDLLFHELRPALKSYASVELKSVLCLAENEVVAGFDAQIEQVGIPPHNFIRNFPGSDPAAVPTGLLRADLRRIARGIGNCLVGLALSSGAAKGFAHIGILQVLEENGIEADVVAGASMGA